MVVVPDASVILKWALPSAEEPGADRALALLDAIREGEVHAVVPSLWLYEVANTIARRFPAQASQWLAALVKLGLPEAPISEPWLNRALALTRAYPVTFYDAAYHATALILRGIFVTADRQYVGLTSREGAVTLLSDWTPPRRASRKLR